MPDRKLASLHYRKLVADIVRIYDNARRSLVEAHWLIGQRIVEIEQDGASRAAYGSGLLSKIAADLSRERGQGFSETNLRRFRSFYLTQKQPRVAELGWSQQNELLAVRDTGVRRSLEKRAIRDGLKRDELRQLVRKTLKKETPSRSRVINVTPLVPKRGLFHVYQIRSGADIGWPDSGALLLDHGFRFYKTLSRAENKAFKAGDIVEACGMKLRKVKRAGKPGSSPGRVVPNSPVSTLATKPGYTYTAYLQKVIDGDTFWAALDLDRGEIAHLKLRLRGIDCPELKTPEGKAAKKFVESVLAGTASLTVFSYKNDNHDRFEADVFFMGQDRRECYLNNLLLERGHAVRVPGY